MNVELGVWWLGAEDTQDVVDRVDGNTGRVEFGRVATAEETFPRRVEPQLVVDTSLLLGFTERVLTQLAVLPHLLLFHNHSVNPTSIVRYTLQKYPHINGYFVASFPYVHGVAVPYTFVSAGQHCNYF